VLNQVADGVWVRQSAWVLSNAIAVRGEGGLVLVDPGIDGSDLNQLADDLDRLGIPVVAGFSTHPHWDHLLWHRRFGDVPRYAAPAAAHAASAARERGQRMAAESASGIGAVAGGPEVAARLGADHDYIDALRRGTEPADARLGPDSDWLPIHRSNLEQARGQ
jgi:glyoxylase-like metal-dependent hydrolase (beta-lactamase superfamily II)